MKTLDLFGVSTGRGVEEEVGGGMSLLLLVGTPRTFPVGLSLGDIGVSLSRRTGRRPDTGNYFGVSPLEKVRYS